MSDENKNDMQSLMMASLEAAKEEAKAQLLAAQAQEKAAMQSQRVADSNEELIKGVNKLICTAGSLVDGMDMMEAVAEGIRSLIQLNSMVVTILAKGRDDDEVKQLQAKMHELAMSAASKGIKLDQSTRFEGPVSTDGGDIIAGDKKES